MKDLLLSTAFEVENVLPAYSEQSVKIQMKSKKKGTKIEFSISKALVTETENEVIIPSFVMENLFKKGEKK